MTSPAPPAVAVFGSSAIAPGSAPWHEAYRCGALLAERGYAVITGGYGGVMQAVSHGATDGGAHVVGVTAPAVFPARPGANPYVVEEEAAPTLTFRIHRLLERADAVIALPGSIGTFTELVMAWNLAHVAPFGTNSPLPIAAVGEVWRSLLASVETALDGAAAPIARCADVDAAVAHIAAALS